MNYNHYNYIQRDRMEYQKIMHFLDNSKNQPSKFRNKTCIKVGNGTCRKYNKTNEIKFKPVC